MFRRFSRAKPSKPQVKIKPKVRPRLKTIYMGSGENFGQALEAYSQTPKGMAKIATVIIETRPVLKRPQSEIFLGVAKARVAKDGKRIVVQLTRPALTKLERKKIEAKRRWQSRNRRDREFVPGKISENHH